MTKYPPLGRRFRFFCFVDCNESKNYSARTGVRHFMRLRGQSGVPLSCFLSVNKNRTTTMIHSEVNKDFKMRGHHVSLKQIVPDIRLEE